jgi:hypothetical protein
VGLVNNEDSFLADRQLGLFLVADGLEGPKEGLEAGGRDHPRLRVVGSSR